MSAQLKRVSLDPRESSALHRTVAPPEPRQLFTPARVFFLVVVLLLALGYWFPTERYISPKRGAGYVLGIIGGSAMLVLLLYPLRKRIRWMSFMGSTKYWFQAHMVLGVVGPLLI